MKKEFGRSRKVLLDVYNEVKYTALDPLTIEHTYEGVTAFEVVGGDEAMKIEAETDGSCIDDYHEYLVLYFEDGDTGTFRNSYVDMFLVG